MPSSVWNHCVEELLVHLQPDSINMWVRPLDAIEKDGDLHLLAPNQFVLDWIAKNCLDYIKKTLPKEMGLKLSVSNFAHQNGQFSPVNQPLNGSLARPPTPSGAPLNPNYRFDNFVEGDTNQVAYAAAMRVADEPGQRGYNPLLIYGGPGLGKTHLMQAIGHTILHNNPQAKVMYQRSETFVREMVSALGNHTMDAFKKRYRSVDVLLMDDVHMFIGKTQSQEEFFHTFNELSERSQQIVLTCDCYPVNVENLQPRLASRFVSGFYHAIQPPKLETRVAILKQKAEQEGHSLPEDVLFFIARHVQSNVRELEGTLRQVSVNASLSDTPITLDFVRQVIGDQIAANRRRISIENIQSAVSQYYGLSTGTLLSASRRQSIVRPRQIAMALARDLTTHSFPEIGAAFGGRDHTTVINACNKIEQLRRENDETNQDYISLRQRLGN